MICFQNPDLGLGYFILDSVALDCYGNCLVFFNTLHTGTGGQVGSTWFSRLIRQDGTHDRTKKCQYVDICPPATDPVTQMTLPSPPSSVQTEPSGIARGRFIKPGQT